MIKVGVIDGNVSEQLSYAIDGVRAMTAYKELRGGHGTQVVGCILEHCPEARLSIAQVFDRRREATIQAVVDAMYWLSECGVQIINMSFGISIPNSRLARACQDIEKAGVLLVASAPARGAPVFPSSFEYCISVSGDARCAPSEISWLKTPLAEFGTHPFIDKNIPERGGGASIAAARVTGIVAALMEKGISSDQIRSHLIKQAAYIGIERRYG